MAPFLVPVAASIAGAAVTGLMNKGGGMAKMPSIATPQVGDPDKTPGNTAAIALNNAASTSKLSNTNTAGGRLLGG